MERKVASRLFKVLVVLVFALGMVAMAGNGNGYGKGGKNGGNTDSAGGGGSITEPSADISVADGHYAGTTTATVGAGIDANTVLVECYQGGSIVMRAYEWIDASFQATFVLGPTPNWLGGDANCTAEAGSFNSNNRWHGVASTTFNVYDTTN